MRLLTVDEAKRQLPAAILEAGKPALPESRTDILRFSFGDLPASHLVANAVKIVDSVGPWEDAWLWVPEPDTWNRPLLHLYYRFRESFHDFRLIREAPVHFFHGFETTDLVSLVVLTLLNEWRAQLLTSHDYGRVFISASHWIDVWRSDHAELQAVRSSLVDAGFEEIESVPAASE
jgi:hypothetical protein